MKARRTKAELLTELHVLAEINNRLSNELQSAEDRCTKLEVNLDKTVVKFESRERQLKADCQMAIHSFDELRGQAIKLRQALTSLVNVQAEGLLNVSRPLARLPYMGECDLPF